MACYSIGLFVSGWIGERVKPRKFLAVGTLLNALTLFTFGCTSKIACITLIKLNKNFLKNQNFSHKLILISAPILFICNICFFLFIFVFFCLFFFVYLSGYFFRCTISTTERSVVCSY
jgi:hypothetical protein